MLKFFSRIPASVAIAGLMTVAVVSPAVAEASTHSGTYHCQAQLSWQPSMIWNAGYWIAVRPGMGGNATAQVRMSRNYQGAMPRAEMIQMRCVPGSNGAEFDCVENTNFARRPELLAAQFFVNGWAVLYATPAAIWQPYAIGNFHCLRW